MKNNIIFYKCKSIDEQLILVMREVLKLGLKNVTIHIPIGQSIDYVIKFFNKRKFKFSLNDSNRHEISLKILDEDKLDYSNVNFYLIYNKIQNKCKFLNSLDVRNNDINIISFSDLNKEDFNQIINKGFEVSIYKKCFTSIIFNDLKLNENKIKEEYYINNHLINEQIRNKFIETFFIAKNEIDIISPWISENVVDEQFVELLENTLQRNVTIKILYGIGENNDDRNKKSEKLASLLINKFQKYGNLFKIKKTNIHYKLLLCDDKYLISGSYNFLSFKGDYQNDDNRLEGAEYIENKEDINLKRNLYFNY